MKNVMYIAFVIALQATSITAMEKCCDHKGLESKAKRYVMCIDDSKQISVEGIVKDLQFLSPEALKSTNFAKYTQKDSFEVIASQTFTPSQQKAVEIFTQARELVKDDALLEAELCVLLDRVLIHLKPSIPVNIYTHPFLADLMNNPSSKLEKLLVSPLVAPSS